ncbi:putative reverse transcriptase domain-containing protein [Tanacetum coccineum]
MLYDGSVIAKETNVISIADSEETLMLEEESRSKMILKQSDPMVSEKKVNIKPINYAELNRLSEDFGKRFVQQQELSDEQAFRLQTSHPNTDQSASSPIKIEAPRELPKVSLVNTSLKKIKYHLGQFDNVVKKRITPDALTEGEWRFEHTKGVFLKEIIPFVKTLKDIFNIFDKDLLNECFEIQKKQFLIENDRLLDQIISQDIVNIIVNSSLDINTSVNVNSSAAMNDSVNYVEMCNKCLELEAELIKQHNMVEKDEYNRLSKSFSKLEQHCISLELAMQLNKEIFQKNNTSVNQTEPSFDQLFELNNLKAELQAKDTTIEKLKANIKCLNKTFTTNNVKKDIDEIETINIELEHMVTKLIAENKHLKQTYKQLYDSIKPSRVRAKEHVESLVNQKFKGKDIVDNAAQVSNDTTIAPGMYKIDPVTLAPKDKKNRETHTYYLKHTMEQAAILREIVEQAKLLNPLDSTSYFSCKYVKLIQDFLGYVRDTCPDIHKPSKKLVVVTPSTKRKQLGRTFTLVGNACLLTRIIATNKVALRKPIPLEVVAQEFVVTKVYTRRPKVTKTNGSSRKPNIAKSVISNKIEPGTSRGSNTSVAPSSSYSVDLRKPDLSYLHVFGALCYPNNDSEDLGKLQAKADIGIFIGYAPNKKSYRIYNQRTQKIIETIHVNFDEPTAMASEQLGSGPGLQSMTPATSSLGLVSNPILQQPCNPPPRDEWDHLFQPMFDEYFNPPTIFVSPVPVTAAPRVVDLADSLVSTSIDQDAPSTSIPSTQDQEHSLIIS